VHAIGGRWRARMWREHTSSTSRLVWSVASISTGPAILGAGARWWTLPGGAWGGGAAEGD
jgi:hypothetical protein